MTKSRRVVVHLLVYDKIGGRVGRKFRG